MKRSSLALLTCLAASFLSACAHPTTVLLVRHAERDTSNKSDRDPPLTAAGTERAEALAIRAAADGVSEIYVTQYRRTQETARPAATSLGLTPLVFDVGKDPAQQARDIVADILARHTGAVVLVVGHSNTVPLVIEALGAAKPVIGEDEFNRLFVLVRRDDGTCEVREERYGR